MNFIINSILNNKILRNIIFALIGMLIMGVIFTYLTHRISSLKKTATDAQTNANRAADKATGLEIIINSNTQAAEIERQRETANREAQNSNQARANLANVQKSNGITGAELDKLAREKK